MKKQILSVLLTVCMALTLLPTVALAAEPAVPSVDGKNIYANGAQLLLEDGATSHYTKVRYKLAESDPWTALSGYENIDLSDYTILGGAKNGPFAGDSNITIDGGKVGDVFGGNGASGDLTGNVTIVMNGGSVKRLLACGPYNGAGSSGKTVSFAIHGGTVRGGDDYSVNLSSRNYATTTSLLIDGGVINGIIAVKSGGSFIIQGGNITGEITGPAPTNGTDSVYKTTLTLKDGDDTVNGTDVAGLTFYVDYDYGMDDVQTDANGKLYVYLPENTTVTAATADGENYTNSEGVSTTIDGSAAGVLKKTLRKLLSVTPPSPVTLTSEYATADAIIAGSELPTAVTITADDDATTLPCIWTFSGTYSAAAGAVNTFHWAAETTGYDVNGKIVAGDVTITNQAAPGAVAMPVITPNGGTFTGTQTVTITCDTDGAAIYYTTNGAVPTAESRAYSAPLAVSETATVKAIAVKDGMTNSAVAAAAFTKRTGGGGGGHDGYTPITYTVPVESGDNSLNASATVSSGTATLSVNERRLDAMLTDADTSGNIRIDAGLNQTINTLAVPAFVIDKIAHAANDSGKNVAGLAAALDSGVVSLDAKALAALGEQATGSTISIHAAEIAWTGLSATQKKTLTGDHADDLIVEVTIKSGGVAVTSYAGGKITVTLPYMLNAGETASDVSVWHLAPNGSLTLMKCSYDETAKTVSFVTDHLSYFLVGCNAGKGNPDTGIDNPFTDVDRGDWFFEDVMNMYYMELMEGTGDTTFDPHGTITRGMIVAILYRLEGEPAVSGTCPFDDVPSGKYYENAVTWAAANKILYGCNNNQFAPEDPVTREQLAEILYRYERLEENGFAAAQMFPLNIPDADTTGDWAYKAMCWCIMNGIIDGSNDGALAPQGYAQRCQVAAILHRFIGKTAK